MQIKICSKCHQEKSLKEFYTRQDCKYGVNSQCKECEKQYQILNKDKIQKYLKEYYQKHKEKQLNGCRKRYRAKRKEILERCKIYYQLHKEQTKMHPSSQPNNKKNNRLIRMYGITLDDYNKMFQEQSGVCAICGKHEKIFNKGNKLQDLSVDHNHKTGKVRGLLCLACNYGLGVFKDNTELLLKSINYLNKHKD